MLRSSERLIGYKLAAKDGIIGKVKDFVFEEVPWTIRWLVADTGTWLAERKVLISPVSLGSPDWESRLFPVNLTKQQIESAPSLDADAPVSREYETRWFDKYGWAYYWGGSRLWGQAAYPGMLATRQEKEQVFRSTPEAGTEVLRSVDEVTGYHVQALDGEVGHIEEFILDDETWLIRYIVVDTRNWLPGRKVLVSPSWIDAMKWAEKRVFVGLEQEKIKESPKYDPKVPVNREYEARLYDYYGRPVYW